MKQLIIILFGLWFIGSSIWAQETIVVGEVYDAGSGEPLPNVNIYLQGTQIGTSTNTEGTNNGGECGRIPHRTI